MVGLLKRYFGNIVEQPLSLSICLFVALSDLRIVLLALQTYGARSTTNLILGRKELKPDKGIAHCKRTFGQISGRNVDLVETPAWYRVYKPCDTTQVTKTEIVLSVSRVDMPDMPFTEASRRSEEEPSPSECVGSHGCAVQLHRLAQRQKY